MPIIPNITPPITGQESNSNRIGPQGPGNHQTSSVRPAPDPTRVQQMQDQNVYADRQKNPFSPNLDSNYDRFLQALRDTPDAVKEYGDLFFSKMGNLVNAGIDEGFAQELSTYMNMLNMSVEDLLNMLKNRQGQSQKFAGPFFDMLRQIAHSSGPDNLTAAVLDFLRKYDSLTSGEHILKNIISNLNTIRQSLPQSAGDQLANIMGKLYLNLPNGQNHVNLAILKNEVIPFLSNYISQTRDFGAVRSVITMLTLNLARYDSGTFDSMLQALRNLTSYSQVGAYMDGISVEELAARLSEQQLDSDPHLQSLVNVISRGLNGEAGYQNRPVFMNMLSSILLNESVYMPLVHMMIPAELDGRQFFSEMWIDPNDKGGRSAEEGGGRAVKLLVKFDIKDLGYFELILLVQDGKVDMQLYYPPSFPVEDKTLREDLSSIMERNHLSFRSVFMGKCEKPRAISEVFPKVYEGRNAVNVTI